jgi:hypothetical protein
MAMMVIYSESVNGSTDSCRVRCSLQKQKDSWKKKSDKPLPKPLEPKLSPAKKPTSWSSSTKEAPEYSNPKDGPLNISPPASPTPHAIMRHNIVMVGEENSDMPAAEALQLPATEEASTSSKAMEAPASPKAKEAPASPKAKVAPASPKAKAAPASPKPMLLPLAPTSKESPAPTSADAEQSDAIAEITNEEMSVISVSRAPVPFKVDPMEAARRQAVIQDSWEFYRLICSLVTDRERYNGTFTRLQKDPVYPYLNSLTSVNDLGDVASENFEKAVLQEDEPEYEEMTKLEVSQALERKANETQPAFVDICKAIAGELGIEELGIGPVKAAPVALRKAQRKYEGDLLKVTDYCRALLIVDDMAALLGLLELIRDSYGTLIRRVKLSNLKADTQAKPGGYRDCIINIEVNEHICELQIHLRDLWEICGTAGYKHYAHCLEYQTDSFKDAYASLKGLDRKSLRALIDLSEDLTKPYPLDNVKCVQERLIMDYFALAGLYYKNGNFSFAEIYFRRLVELRKETPDVGMLHPLTVFLNRYLLSCLKKQGKVEKFEELEAEIAAAKEAEGKEEEKIQEIQAKKEADLEENQDETVALAPSESFWDTLAESVQQGTTTLAESVQLGANSVAESVQLGANSAVDLIMDPNRKIREEEEAARSKIKVSKQTWRAIRRERYPFLDGVVEEEEEEEGMDLDEEGEVKEEAVAPTTVEEVKEETPVPLPIIAVPSKEVMEEEVIQPTASVEAKSEPKAVVEDTKKDEPAPEELKIEKIESVEMDAYPEEKKEDTPDAVNESKDVVVEDPTVSALDRLMESACSMCAPSRATAVSPTSSDAKA